MNNETFETFDCGDKVDVRWRHDSDFNDDFTGRVVEFRGKYIIVEDQAGDCWSCDPGQISLNTD